VAKVAAEAIKAAAELLVSRRLLLINNSRLLSLIKVELPLQKVLTTMKTIFRFKILKICKTLF
jgi:hypothetical protein